MSLSLVLYAHTLALLLILPPGKNHDTDHHDAENPDDDEYEFECDSMSLCVCNEIVTTYIYLDAAYIAT